MKVIKWLIIFRVVEKGESKEPAVRIRVKEKNNDSGMKLKAYRKRKILNLLWKEIPILDICMYD